MKMNVQEKHRTFIHLNENANFLCLKYKWKKNTRKNIKYTDCIMYKWNSPNCWLCLIRSQVACDRRTDGRHEWQMEKLENKYKM